MKPSTVDQLKSAFANVQAKMTFCGCDFCILNRGTEVANPPSLGKGYSNPLGMHVQPLLSSILNGIRPLAKLEPYHHQHAIMISTLSKLFSKAATTAIAHSPARVCDTDKVNI